MSFALLVCTLSVVFGQSDYVQFLVVRLTPKPDKIAAFEAGLGNHNKKYHTADPYKAFVWSIQTGPGSGGYYYVMGPATFAQMDARITTPEHDADWNNNVLAHCSDVGEAGYWRADSTLHYMPAGNPFFDKSRLRYVTVKPGQGDRYEEQLMKIVEVYKQKKYSVAYNVYWHYGASQGPHVAVGIDFDKWSYLDTGGDFVDDFNSIHGEEAWTRFIEELDLSIERAMTYDELIQYMPDLSSN